MGVRERSATAGLSVAAALLGLPLLDAPPTLSPCASPREVAASRGHTRLRQSAGRRKKPDKTSSANGLLQVNAYSALVPPHRKHPSPVNRLNGQSISERTLSLTAPTRILWAGDSHAATSKPSAIAPQINSWSMSPGCGG